MQTTAGSLALLFSEVPRDAVIVRQLRQAGAIILGKTNLSEWANFRGFAPFNAFWLDQGIYASAVGCLCCPLLYGSNATSV